MEINRYVIGLVLLIVIILLTVFSRRNRKDRKVMEESIKASEVQPEKHKDEESHS